MATSASNSDYKYILENIKNTIKKFKEELKKPIPNYNKKVIELTKIIDAKLKQILLELRMLDSQSINLFSIENRLDLTTDFINNLKNIITYFNIRQLIKYTYYDSEDNKVEQNTPESILRINITINSTNIINIDTNINIDTDINIDADIKKLINLIIREYTNFSTSRESITNFIEITYTLKNPSESNNLNGILPYTIPVYKDKNNESPMKYTLILHNVYKREVQLHNNFTVVNQFLKDDNGRLHHIYINCNLQKKKIINSYNFENRKNNYKDWSISTIDDKGKHINKPIQEIYDKIGTNYSIPKYNETDEYSKKFYYMFTLINQQTFEGNLSELFKNLYIYFNISDKNITLMLFQSISKYFIYDFTNGYIVMTGRMQILMTDPIGNDGFFNSDAIYMDYKYIYDVNNDKIWFEFEIVFNNEITREIDIKIEIPQQITSRIMFIDTQSLSF